MKRRDLEKHLRQHGCRFDRHRGKHDGWINEVNLKWTTIPRHREIKVNTVRSICRALDVPEPDKMT